MTHLQQHPWSGNVRELENVVRRLVVLTDVEGEIKALVARGRHGYGPVRQLAEPPGRGMTSEGPAPTTQAQ